MIKTLVLFLLLIFSIGACGKPISEKENLNDSVIQVHVPIVSYTLARQYLFGILHYNNGIVTDVYCDNNYNASHGVGQGKIPDPNFVNCEHTWPQSKFGPHEIAIKKTDLHHLYPTASFANSARGNHPFSIIKNGDTVCGTSFKGKIPNTDITAFQPPSHHKGNVARAMFYISVRYKMRIDPMQEATFRKWHESDPVDSFEIIRNLKIKEIQGNTNPFIDDPSLVNTINDF
jgi:hypothetical protein